MTTWSTLDPCIYVGQLETYYLAVVTHYTFLFQKKKKTKTRKKMQNGYKIEWPLLRTIYRYADFNWWEAFQILLTCVYCCMSMLRKCLWWSWLQVDDYPTLLFYPSGDKSDPVSSKWHIHYSLDYYHILWPCFLPDMHSTLQIKLSTKSSLKELAASINKNLKKQDPIIKDEL